MKDFILSIHKQVAQHLFVLQFPHGNVGVNRHTFTALRLKYAYDNQTNGLLLSLKFVFLVQHRLSQELVPKEKKKKEERIELSFSTDLNLELIKM